MFIIVFNSITFNYTMRGEDIMQSRSGAFGPGFIPGKVKSVRDSISHALGRRWSGRPAKIPAEDAETGTHEQKDFRSSTSQK